MFTKWEDCEKLSLEETEAENLSKEEIPRHFRAMINVVLFLCSKGKEVYIATEDVKLMSLAKRWAIGTMTRSNVESWSAEAAEKYHREMKIYESQKRAPTRSLWTAPRERAAGQK